MSTTNRPEHLALEKSSLLLPGCIAYPGLVGNPVRFPSLAAVLGEGLFKMGRVRSHARPVEPHKDAFAIQCVLGVKLTASFLELTDLRYNHDAILAVGPIESPLTRLRIVQTQGQSFEVAGGTIDLDLVQLGAAVPHLEAGAGTVKLHPVSRACQRIQATL